ncbi:NO-inducible flavohemoprotein [Neopusillimonas maritima]|uniref:nitric oxide dioxygenase n=1 Tax=Neopusillimonas maritima TaxID=2026239 RepID=A0ABX9MSC7_9BURK|nr:NO-inducible flavohemoprotein [Neopusillimonas maritima]RII81712.1 nitric oxide dioxygenase [Neopusillimonas maritima]
MLSEAARPYIQASVPVLREQGVTITKTFYKNMFSEHPELTRIFNMGNQASGAQQQSLAAAVFAYADNIDQPEALTPVVSRIVHKHASVGIRAEHYPIVGRHLLGAIQETLGEAATPDLLSAWEEAYGLLANAFIEEERKLYAAAETEPGQLLNMTVQEVQDQSLNVRSFLLTPEAGASLPSFMPGQYISVEALLPDGMRQLRQYSLSDAPGKTHFRISVKREAAGKETPAGRVSNWLHDTVKAGDTLRISPPFGDFTPDTKTTEPIVLLSAGVGVTPMISALNDIAHRHPGRRVIFGHAARSPAFHAHRDELAHAIELMPNLVCTVFYEDVDGDHSGNNWNNHAVTVQSGRMNVSALPEWDVNEIPVYMCGPMPFMQAQWKALVAKGVPASRIHQEVFGPGLLDHLR